MIQEPLFTFYISPLIWDIASAIALWELSVAGTALTATP
jgi:hypothetical protein